MSIVTHRQYLTWQEWLRRQWNQPNRSDHYLMQLSSDIKNIPALLGYNKKVWNLKDSMLSWTFTVDQSQSQEDIERNKEQAKQAAQRAHELYYMRRLGAIQ